MEFAKLVRLFLPSAVEGIFKVRQRSHHRLVEKLQEIDFVTRGIVQTGSDTEITLQVLDDEAIHKLLSGEANKFLLASLLSRQRAMQTQDSNAAWQTVEHYYAAYYAIHYMLRITGVSITNLDSTATNLILRAQLSKTKVNSVPGGLYVLRYDDVNKNITLKTRSKKNGGSHQEAWQLWVELVDKLQNAANSDIGEYAREVGDLIAHKAFLVRSVGHYNPPELRGEINYQFKGGAWKFEKDSAKTVRKLQLAIEQPNTSTADRGVNAESLITNNKIIINLAKAIFLHSSERYPKSVSSSIKNMYGAYVN
ncbi:hypothetical protein GCM10027343_26540 [Noviherbaspirillum agri]